MAIPKHEELCEQLFEKASGIAVASIEGSGKTFSAEQLLDLDIVPSKDDLLLVCQTLANDQRVRLLQLDGKVHYAVRKAEIAEKLRRLTSDELMIYQHVESSGMNGSWTKTLKNKTSMAQTAINKCIKVLESRGLIKSIKNIKNPMQKSYILAHLNPGEDVRGGPWHADGELDTDLISIIAEAVIRFIEEKSWGHKRVKVEQRRSISPVALDAPHGLQTPPATTAAKRKRSSAHVDDIEDIHVRSRKKLSHHDTIQIQVAHGPNFTAYPTTDDVLHYVQNVGILKSDVQLKYEDVQSLLDMLMMDDRVEKIGAGYRTILGVRGVHEAMKGSFTMSSDDQNGDLPENGLMHVPCGRCPVFDLCEEGGPVNARNCVYFDKWLQAGI